MRVKLPEIAVLLALFSLLVHLLTSAHVGLWYMILALAIVLIIIAMVFKPWGRDRDSGRKLWAALSALAGGFWIFSLFRYLGFVKWPIGHPQDLTGYLHMLYFHLVLSITVLVPVLIVYYRSNPLTAITWGNWKKIGFGPYGLFFLLLTSLGLWLFALYDVLETKSSLAGPLMGFVTICLIKAFLTGITEEVCYRGILQPLAIRHIGIPLGITLQSCLFTAFHMHLGAAPLPKEVFLGAVMAVGLIFGMVTRLTAGIGWACVMHTAINVVIEWRNLS